MLKSYNYIMLVTNSNKCMVKIANNFYDENFTPTNFMDYCLAVK